MTAQDYPVEFGFHAQDDTYYGPSGSVGFWHLGVDRYTPTGTTVVINGIEIGKTGATGIVAGPHLHIQAWQGDNPRNAIDPAPYEFKPGVVKVVSASSDFGNYIIVDVNGTNVAYCHLSVQEAKVGQDLRENNMNPTRAQIATMWLLANFSDLAELDTQTRENIYTHYENLPWQELLNDLSNGDRRKEVVKQFTSGSEVPQLNDKITDLTHKLEVVQASNGDATKWQTLKTLIKELIS